MGIFNRDASVSWLVGLLFIPQNRRRPLISMSDVKHVETEILEQLNAKCHIPLKLCVCVCARTCMRACARVCAIYHLRLPLEMRIVIWLKKCERSELINTLYHSASRLWSKGIDSFSPTAAVTASAAGRNYKPIITRTAANMV